MQRWVVCGGFNQLACLWTKKEAREEMPGSTLYGRKGSIRDGGTEEEIPSNDSVLLHHQRKSGLMMPSLFGVDIFFEGR